MRNQLRKYAEGRNKSAGTVAREAFEKSRRSTGVTVRGRCNVFTRVLRSQLTSTWPQIGERSSRTSASQYSMQDLEISNDTADSFSGACRAAGRYDLFVLRRTSRASSSLAAIAKRVLGLLVVGVIGGLVLFKLGLSAFQ